MVILQPDRWYLKRDMQAFAPHVKGRVLDVGAGEVKRYKNLFTCDEYVTLDMNAEFKPDIIASATSLPMADRSFDTVISNQVLGDIADPDKAISEMARVLKTGGHLLFSESFINELHDEPYDYWRFTPHGYKELCQRHGLEIIEMRQRGGYWSSCAQNAIRYCLDRFQLYKRPLIGGIAKLLIYPYARFMIWLDIIDKSDAARRFSIGWTVLARKK